MAPNGKKSQKKGKSPQRKQGGGGSSGQSGSRRVNSAPTAIGTRESNRPIRASASSRCVTISHRELLTTVTMTAAFEWSQHVLNPGLFEGFPWLSAIANRFESYKFRKLSFEYVPRTSSTKDGAITLIFDYDPQDSGPNSLQEGMSYAHSQRGSMWQSIKLDTNSVDRDLIPRRFTRSTPEFLASSEPRMSDLGSLFIASDGGLAAACGEVWVDYTVDLVTPQIGDVPGTIGLFSAMPLSGTLADSIFKGDTATSSVIANTLGQRLELRDGDFEFLDNFLGILTGNCMSAVAAGAVKFFGRTAPGGLSGYPQQWSTGKIDIPSVANVSGMLQNLVFVPKGAFIRIAATNPVAASSASGLRLYEIADFEKYQIGTPGVWSSLTAF